MKEQTGNRANRLIEKGVGVKTQEEAGKVEGLDIWQRNGFKIQSKDQVRLSLVIDDEIVIVI